MSFSELFSMILSGNNFAILGASLAAIMACIGSAKGVGIAGEASSGVLAEDPSKFTSCVVLQALPGSQGIYGFVTAFMIFIKLGMFAGGTTLTTGQGVYLFAAALPIAFTGLFSAIAQGKVAAAGINMIARREGQLVKAITAAGLVETYAIFAFLISLLPIIFFNA